MGGLGELLTLQGESQGPGVFPSIVFIGLLGEDSTFPPHSQHPNCLLSCSSDIY